eukprot:979750-Pelagomonas_calceolata.AAC.2
MHVSHRRLTRLIKCVAAIVFVTYTLFAITCSRKRAYSVAFQSQDHRDIQQSSLNYAYVTYVFDEEAAKGAIVLLYSLLEVGSISPRIVMTIPGCICFQTEEKIRAVQGCLFYIERQITHPSKVRLFRQHLRFNKLHSWNLTAFDKVIMLDADMLVLKNIEHVFRKPPISAVEDPGAPEKFNSGFLVLSPDRALFEEMLFYLPVLRSYNSGDQGYLNRFFSWKNHSFHRLPFLYNVFPRLRKHESWTDFKDNIFILHFTAQVKPWDFFARSHVSSAVDFDPEVSYEWTKRWRKVEGSFKNATESMCLDMKRGNYELLPDRFELFINTYNNEFAAAVLYKYYSTSVSILNTFVVWHDPVTRPSFFLKSVIGRAHASRIITFSSDSLNNRFSVFRRMSARFALIVDDDVLVSRVSDVDFAFEVALQHATSTVGFFPRSHHRESNALQYDFESDKLDTDGHRMYSLVLTKFLFVTYDYLYMYTCLLPQSVLHYVDRVRNCEDILMNWMISGFTGQPPIVVSPAGSIMDAGTNIGNNSGRISQKIGHLKDRSQCLSAFESMLGQCPLKHTNAVTTLHRNVPFKKVASLQAALEDSGSNFRYVLRNLTLQFERQQLYNKRFANTRKKKGKRKRGRC